MVKIRLMRMGKKKQPFYRIVAIDSRVARDGKYLDNLGTYNPRTEPAALMINSERAFYWLSKGAKPSDTVHSLLRRQGLMMRWHLQKLGMDEAKIGEEMQKWEALQVEKQKRHEARREESTPAAHEVLVRPARCPLVSRLRHDPSSLRAAATL